MTPEKRRELGDRSQALGKLSSHVSWGVLVAELDRLEKLYSDRMARDLLSGGVAADVVPQRRVDYWRGFFAGARWVVTAPVAAENMLRKALESDV